MPNSQGGGFYCLRNCVLSIAQRRRFGSLPDGEIIVVRTMEPFYDYRGVYICHTPCYDWQSVGPIPEGAVVVRRLEA